MAQKNKSTAPQAEDEMAPDLMTLMDEDGNEVTFEVVDNFEHDGTRYLAAVEYVEDEEDIGEAQLIILKVGEDAEGEFLDIVDDDEELFVVSKIVEKRLEGQFDIEN